MNKEATLVLGSMGGGLVAQGVNSLYTPTENPLLNIVQAVGFGFGATKVTGTDTKAHALRGALMGASLVNGLVAIKKFADKNISAKLTGDSKPTAFVRGALGLNGAEEEYYEDGLNAVFVGADGQMYEADPAGLNGTYMDEAGNVFEDGLNGSDFDNDGLNGVLEDVYGLNAGVESIYGLDEENGLNGSDEELYEELYN